MPREARAYLADIVESCDAIAAALEGVGVEEYKADRLVRSAVEREFTIIGEAVLVLSRHAPDIFGRITQARRIVDFRNQLTHEYRSVNDVFVWGIADRDVPILRGECIALIERLGEDSTQGPPNP